MNENKYEIIVIRESSRVHWKKVFQILTYPAFGLYLFFIGYDNGNKVMISADRMNDYLGMSEVTYDFAFRELVNKGFLVKTNEVYCFYDWVYE